MPSETPTKTSRPTLPMWGYKLLLVLAAAVWGLGTVVIKDTVDAFPPLWLVGVRFTSAGIIMWLLCWRRMRRELSRDLLVNGSVLGVFLGVSYGLNTSGLVYTTAAISTVITAVYCVIVPFVAWAISKARPTGSNIIAAVLGLAGIAFVSLQTVNGLTMGLGEALTLGSAVVYALHISFMSKLGQGRDALALTVVQFLVGGGICLVGGLMIEGVPSATLFTDRDVIVNLFYLVVFASVLALSLQNVGLAHVPAGPAALLLATESVSGVIFAVLLLGEMLSARMLIGFALVAVAVFINERPTNRG